MWLAEQSLGAAPEPLRCVPVCSGPANQGMGSCLPSPPAPLGRTVISLKL